MSEARLPFRAVRGSRFHTAALSVAAAGNKKASVCTLRGLGTAGGDYDSARAPAAGREAWEKRQAWKIDPRSADARTQLSSSSAPFCVLPRSDLL